MTTSVIVALDNILNLSFAASSLYLLTVEDYFSGQKTTSSGNQCNHTQKTRVECFQLTKFS